MSNITCSTLEDANKLFNRLMNDKNFLPLKHVRKLINDFSELFKDSDFYDVEITVGMDQDIKTFNAHSTILRARSPYFGVALSSNWVKRSNNGMITFQKENVSPKIFQIILKYIYNGIIEIDYLEPEEIFELHKACDELCLNELSNDLKTFMIKNYKAWIQQNIVYIYQSCRHHNQFTILQDYCNRSLCINPGLFLKSDDFKLLEKEMLVSLLKKKNLSLKEIDIWARVIQWGIGQHATLDKHVLKWKDEDFNLLKCTLAEIVPLIKFCKISVDDFERKVMPYRKIIDETLLREIYLYFFHKDDWEPVLIVQKALKTPRLLDNKMECLLSSWIEEKYRGFDFICMYDFRLLLQGTCDGFFKSVFKENCYNIGHTLVIMKIGDTGELVGGYNPVVWNNCYEDFLSKKDYWIKTGKSFIFKINKNDVRLSTISKVRKPTFAIHHTSDSENFYEDGEELCEKFIDFDDLSLCNSIADEPYCYYKYNDNSYKKVLPFETKRRIHPICEYEVYHVVNKIYTINNDSSSDD